MTSKLVEGLQVIQYIQAGGFNGSSLQLEVYQTSSSCRLSYFFLVESKHVSFFGTPQYRFCRENIVL